jgi:hypothetical protein
LGVLTRWSAPRAEYDVVETGGLVGGFFKLGVGVGVRGVGARDAKAEDEGFAGRGAAGGFVGREVEALAAVFPVAGSGFLGLLTLAREVFLRAEATVGGAAFEEGLGGLLVFFHVFGLEVGALVPVDAHPLQAVQDGPGGFLGGALHVGVFNAQNQFAAGLAGEQPVVQGRAGAADMQKARGGRREAHADLRHGHQ